MITTTPQPDDITVTRYTVDSNPVSPPWRERLEPVQTRLMGHAVTILYDGRIVWHALHRMGDALARRSIHTMCGVVILCAIL